MHCLQKVNEFRQNEIFLFVWPLARKLIVISTRKPIRPLWTSLPDDWKSSSWSNNERRRKLKLSMLWIRLDCARVIRIHAISVHNIVECVGMFRAPELWTAVEAWVYDGLIYGFCVLCLELVHAWFGQCVKCCYHGCGRVMVYNFVFCCRMNLARTMSSRRRYRKCLTSIR